MSKKELQKEGKLELDSKTLIKFVVDFSTTIV